MMKLKTLFLYPALFSSFLMAMPALADVKVSDAWVRATAPGQKVGAAYMTLNSSEASSMVYVESPRAGTVEMHYMNMQDGVMKMRQLQDIALTPNKAVKLAPGGMHLMLFDLNAPLKAGEKVRFKACFKDSKGKITHQWLTLPVK